MRQICFVLALAAVWLIQPGTARSQEATFEVYYWSYEESVAGDDDFVDEYSDPVFVSFGLRHWETRRELFRALFTTEIGAGPAKYAGSGTLDGYFYYKFRAEAYLAYEYHDLSPFVGLGYRWLYDDSGGRITSTGFSSYDRQSQYFYLPLGGIYQFTDNFKVKAQYNYLVYGKQTSFLSDIAGFSDIENDQNNGWGVDITFDYRPFDRIGVYTFFRYWDIDDSETTVGFISGSAAFVAFEPMNQTVEFGLGISYKF